jgi:hypothetical protein
MVHRFSETKIVLLISTVVFAAYLPCALWIKLDYETNRRSAPLGTVVHLGYFAPADVSQLTADIRATKHRYFQTIFRWTEETGWPPPENGVIDPHFSVYENDVSLGSPTIFYVPYSKQYALSFYTSDNSDPRRNGRDYWIVRR